ncbi:EF-hand domain-containing protein [Brachymonas denitrificans]|uniref:EF hand n=1 Tax=Brachymonas denitrificans DSM 15123 TaxID=1121117 RepID=A0A1H8J5I2_9BURK|nr:EF-hand domain-containing protein [Brachymonas denitrificans]SEN76193.1 EF hand [Brachymonas denitrificans DSM 15123]
MKKPVRILSALAAAALLAGFSLPASAQTRANFSAIDRDGNGVVTQQELDRYRAQRPGAGRNALSLKQMDADRNGTISRAEYANAHKNRVRPGQRKGAMLGQGQGQGMGRGAAADAPAPQPGVGMGAGQGMGRGMNRPDFADFDTNRDGSISQDELNQYRSDKLEQRAKEGRMMRNASKAQAFGDMDTNKDGKIDATEFSNHQMQQPRGRNR